MSRAETEVMLNRCVKFMVHNSFDMLYDRCMKSACHRYSLQSNFLYMVAVKRIKNSGQSEWSFCFTLFVIQREADEGMHALKLAHSSALTLVFCIWFVRFLIRKLNSILPYSV
uniref:Uncharacterized protein n=1 Tax=Glossina palpalis gambiensis TaxID=67801 RepID=A0A1B0AKE0_9MUSC